MRTWIQKKYELKDEMIEQQGDYWIKEFEDKNNIREQIKKGDIARNKINMAANKIIDLEKSLQRN